MKNSLLPHIEIILPIFNEQENIPLLVKALDSVALKLKTEVEVSYLFVNDGSEDKSNEILSGLHQARGDVRVVELIHNFGHAAALSAGIDHFEGDAAIVMDADLQDSPEALIGMVTAWKKGAKTVVIERGERAEGNRWAFKTFYFLFHKLARNLPPINFGTHCLLDKTVVERLRGLREKNRYFPGLVAYSSGSITPIRFDRHARANGTSRVGTWGLINLAVTACLSFSNVPVRLVSVFGLLCSLVAAATGLTIVGIKIFSDRAIPGWASIMTASMLSSGIQLFCIGLIGEYVARMYEEVKGRPSYLVQNVLEKKGTKKVALIPKLNCV